jgi:tetratricopeptide (TPR) repeat protein
MANLGTSEDCQSIYPLLDHQDPLLVTAAVKTLGRIGDGRTLNPLLRLRQRVRRSALRAEIEDAETAIQARMELLGEEPPPFIKEKSEPFDTGKMAALVVRRFPTKVIVAAHFSLLLGHVWLLFRSFTRAIARFEAATSLRPGWVAPLVAVAMTYARQEQHAQALGAFRRALDIDRSSIEKYPARVRTLARAFFRRADMVEREGRLDIACGLLDEVLAVDLRNAPSGLRFAILQRREELKARQS